MPTYSYACTECENRFDVVQAFSDDALTTCEKCSGRLRKLFGNVGVVFKGSGFYRNDSREAAKSSSGSSSSSSSSSSSEGSSSESSSSSDKSSSSEKSEKPSSSSDKSSSDSKSDSSSLVVVEVAGHHFQLASYPQAALHPAARVAPRRLRSARGRYSHIAESFAADSLFRSGCVPTGRGPCWRGASLPARWCCSPVLRRCGPIPTTAARTWWWPRTTWARVPN